MLNFSSSLAFVFAMTLLAGISGCSDDDPAGQDFCAIGCADTIEVDCANGPADLATCEADCNRLRNDTCGTEYDALLACSMGETVTCEASSGIPIVEVCNSEQILFVACINQ